MVILKLATAPGAFGVVHHLAHVAARGIGWCILTDGLTGNRHSTYEGYQAAHAAFQGLTRPIEAQESK